MGRRNRTGMFCYWEIRKFDDLLTSFLDRYFVIQLARDVRPLSCDMETWIHELENCWDVFDSGIKRPVHRYCRLERFRGVLNELIGMSGKVKQEVVDELEFLLGYDHLDSKTVWNVIREWLKSRGLRKYYNRIPQIIFRLGYPVLEGYSVEKYWWILEDFEKMHKKFEKKKGVVYFPNLRFISFKLMEKYGIRYTFHVPMVRTKRKQLRLDILWCELNKD